MWFVRILFVNMDIYRTGLMFMWGNINILVTNKQFWCVNYTCNVENFSVLIFGSNWNKNVNSTITRKVVIFGNVILLKQFSLFTHISSVENRKINKLFIYNDFKKFKKTFTIFKQHKTWIQIILIPPPKKKNSNNNNHHSVSNSHQSQIAITTDYSNDPTPKKRPTITAATTTHYTIFPQTSNYTQPRRLASGNPTWYRSSFSRSFRPFESRKFASSLLIMSLRCNLDVVTAGTPARYYHRGRESEQRGSSKDPGLWKQAVVVTRLLLRGFLARRPVTSLSWPEEWKIRRILGLVIRTIPMVEGCLGCDWDFG